MNHSPIKASPCERLKMVQDELINYIDRNKDQPCLSHARKARRELYRDTNINRLMNYQEEQLEALADKYEARMFGLWRIE